MTKFRSLLTEMPTAIQAPTYDDQNTKIVDFWKTQIVPSVTKHMTERLKKILQNTSKKIDVDREPQTYYDIVFDQFRQYIFKGKSFPFKLLGISFTIKFVPFKVGKKGILYGTATSGSNSIKISIRIGNPFFITRQDSFGDLEKKVEHYLFDELGRQEGLDVSMLTTFVHEFGHLMQTSKTGYSLLSPECPIVLQKYIDGGLSKEEIYYTNIREIDSMFRTEMRRLIHEYSINLINNGETAIDLENFLLNDKLFGPYVKAIHKVLNTLMNLVDKPDYDKIRPQTFRYARAIVEQYKTVIQLMTDGTIKLTNEIVAEREQQQTLNQRDWQKRQEKAGRINLDKPQ